MAPALAEVRQRVRPTRFDELKAAGQLPTPTGVALAILRLADSDRSTLADITRVLETDPAMSGRILKMANSAFAGATRRITSVRDAVSRLGLRTVRNTALSFSVISQSGRQLCKQFDYNRFWSRSLAQAVAAQAASKHVPPTKTDEAFTCGLLCQVGSLALASIYPREYGTILEQYPHASPAELAEQEEKHLAMTHGELTAAMLEDWGLPETYVEAVRSFERPDSEEVPEDSPAQALARLLHLATQLAEVCVAQDGQRETRMAVVLDCGEQMGIAQEDLLALGDRLVADWQEWGKILNVATHSVPSFTDLAVRAQSAPKAAVATPAPDEQPKLVEEPAPLVERRSPVVNALNILVVDDDPVELEVLTRHLTSAGHQVLTARNGQHALQLVLETNPHLVVAARRLPELDGLAFCRGLRQSKIGRGAYIIMLTDQDDEEELVEALEAGADDYLVKPVRPRIFLARIRAGQRVIQLQQEVDQDKEDLRRYTAEISVANRKLQQAALTDTLTGLLNRRYALERLEAEWHAATQSQRRLACMILDIDHFKKVNDTYGHDVGDAVIRETALVLLRSMRGTDAVCRLGGEEFLIICPDTDLAGSRASAERLRSRVEGNAVRAPGYVGRVTVSIGVAVRRHDMDRLEDLLKAADIAVYEAKKSGRNRVCCNVG